MADDNEPLIEPSALSFKKTGAFRGRTGLERILIFIAVVLFVSVVGLIVGLVLVIKDEDEVPDVCLSDECAMASSRVLQSMDRNVNPCEDFYTYACGNWKKTHVIPEDRSSLNVFGVLRDQVQVINKIILEDPDNYGINETAWKKAKDMYASCSNTDLIEQKNISVTIPLLNEIGGWPVLGTNPGGNWADGSFSLSSLLITLRKYNNRPLIDLYVSSDVKNTTQRIIYLDQPSFGLPGRTYYLEPQFEEMQNAYVKFASDVAVMFGADPALADSEMKDVLAFETEIANITMRAEDRRDNEALYNRMTIAEMGQNFTEPQPTDTIQFNWYDYISGIMGLDDINVTITDSEPVVVRAVPYFQKFFNVLQKYPKRTIANYIVWSIMKNRVNNLPSRFTDVRDEYKKVVYGQATSRARWRVCEDYVMGQMGMAIGQKFVKQEFDETAKDSALEMIGNIRTAFNELLNEVDWMDEHTKSLAREKAEAMRNWIGYPDDLLDNDHLNEIYENVTTDKNEYFQNVLQNLRRIAAGGLRVLREPYDKNVWTTPPSTVNAYYNSVLNNIMFPAGILQPPFYGKNQPKSMNYGGIGVVIGHEITHGFDDRGRQYNKDGDLEQWWEQEIITNFKEKAQCIVDQYSGFLVPEANMTVNGINTQGENIADNGGLKQSYRAYRSWVEQQGKEEPKLPGLDFTHDQLFFVNFAQIWCNNMRQESAINSVQTGVHSPGQFRVVGTLQNSAEFARAFNCPENSNLNPSKKCYVW